MARRNLRYVLNLKTQIAGAAAEVDVLEPKWTEVCVKTAQALPHFAPQHEKRAGRLLHFLRPGQIEIAGIDSAG